MDIGMTPNVWAYLAKSIIWIFAPSPATRHVNECKNSSSQNILSYFLLLRFFFRAVPSALRPSCHCRLFIVGLQWQRQHQRNKTEPKKKKNRSSDAMRIFANSVLETRRSRGRRSLCITKHTPDISVLPSLTLHPAPPRTQYSGSRAKTGTNKNNFGEREHLVNTHTHTTIVAISKYTKTNTTKTSAHKQKTAKFFLCDETCIQMQTFSSWEIV